MSQTDLAEAAGISRNQVQHIEANHNNQRSSAASPQPANPKLDTIYSLARALKVDVNYLVDPSVAVEPIPEPS